MNGNTAVDLIMSRLGNRTQASLRTIVLGEMEIVQSDLVERLDFKPWFLLSEDTTTDCTIAEPRLALPPDFLQEAEDGALWYLLNSTPVYMKRKDWDTLSAGYNDGQGNGPPEYYALTGGYFHLFPAPDIVYTFHMRYYQIDAAPTDTATTNLWLTHAPKLLIAATAQIVAATHLQNADLAATMQGEMQTAVTQLWKATEERLHSNREYNMGEPS